jgi:nucleoside-triphosphatase THEP1
MRERWASAKRGFDAVRLPLAGDRLVVGAGPGAGKSTLQRRLANRLSREGKNVVHVRLPFVADRMGKGATFPA